MFSDRSDVASETNDLTGALTRRRDAGAEVLDLTLSNPTEAGVPYDRQRLTAALKFGLEGPYEPDPLGLRVAREAIASPLGMAPEHVLMTSSTSEAYAHLFRLLCDPGDEVLVPQPSYPLLAHLALFTDVHVATYPLDWDGRWSVDFAALHDAITPRTRALVAVNPNNPTGHYLRRDELEALTSLGLPLIVDEVFHAYPLEAPDDRVRASDAGEGLVFGLDGLSKWAGLPQLKLAWLTAHGPVDMVEAAMERLSVIADAFLSPATPTQHALPMILEAAECTRTAIATRCAENLRVLRAAVADTPLSVPRIEGGWCAPVRVPATRSDEAWALALLDAGVLVHPGYFYDFEGDEAWLVVSLLTPSEVFAEGARRLVQFVCEDPG